MRTVSQTTDPLPLHADLMYTLDAARTSEGVPASSAAGPVERPAWKMEVVVRQMRQHVGRHLKTTKVRPVCLLHSSICPRKPTRRVLLGEAYRTASKKLGV